MPSFPTAGTGATITDLNNWVTHHQSDFPSMLDPGVQNLGIFFAGAAVPFNMNIDARSMEILSSELGSFKVNRRVFTDPEVLRQERVKIFERTWIYVSSGTGYWGPPMRLGAPAEITEIVLMAG